MRRKWITTLRILHYGVSNFLRNAWLTTAATVVMIITLTVVLATFTLHQVFNDTLVTIRQKIDVSVYLADSVTDQQRSQFTSAIKSVAGVQGVDYISKAEARQDYVDQNKGDVQSLQALSLLGDINPFPAILRVHLSDINHLNDISNLVGQQKYKTWQAKPASLNGDRKDAIESIARAAQFSEVAGLTVSGLFLVISIMIIFNTIRMTIFNRRDEIEIMKLIGAEKSFIRGPFIVEASLYGVIAALVSVALVYTVLVVAGNNISRYGIAMGPTIQLFSQWPVLIFLAQIAVGIVIGVVSSALAMRRYLKV